MQLPSRIKKELGQKTGARTSPKGPVWRSGDAEHKEEYSLGLIFDYKEVVGLSGELQERLNKEKPENLLEASHVEGITPAAINVLSIHLKKIDAIRAV